MARHDSDAVFVIVFSVHARVCRRLSLSFTLCSLWNDGSSGHVALLSSISTCTHARTHTHCPSLSLSLSLSLLSATAAKRLAACLPFFLPASTIGLIVPARLQSAVHGKECMFPHHSRKVRAKPYKLKTFSHCGCWNGVMLSLTSPELNCTLCPLFLLHPRCVLWCN